MKEQHEEPGSTTADMAERGARPMGAGTTTLAERPDEKGPHGKRAAGDGTDATLLFAGEESTRFRTRWDSVQTGFVDEPRRAVEQADHLVAEVMQRLAQVFSDERSKLEGQWSRGSDISTEDLRQALRRYRTFFDRLLSV